MSYAFTTTRRNTCARCPRWINRGTTAVLNNSGEIVHPGCDDDDEGGDRMNGPWRGLERELDELERRDPKVAAARKALDDLPAQLARYDRHIAARKAVGKRPVPEDDD